MNSADEKLMSFIILRTSRDC